MSSIFGGPPSGRSLLTGSASTLLSDYSTERVRRKCFISYHHDDQAEVDQFIRTFAHDEGCFMARGLGQEMDQDIIDSSNTDYVMQRIRQKYLRGSSVTLVMIGNYTWSRRYVDWEIQASLRQDRDIVPNGLLGIKLPNFREGTRFPERFVANLKQPNQPDSYALWMSYPNSTQALINAIEQAFGRRTTHTGYINNPRDRFGYNKSI